MKIHELLTDVSKWTTGTLSRTNLGNSTHSRAENAIRWCLAGACIKCYDSPESASEIIQRICNKVGNVGRFNDSHTFEEVRALVLELDI